MPPANSGTPGSSCAARPTAARTTAWAAGGYYARLYLNVAGREPQGIVPQADYERVRDEIAAKLAALGDEHGNPIGTFSVKPQDLYRTVRNVAPDLIVYFGDLAWRSLGTIGHGVIHKFENDTGPDDCNHAQFGAFILAAPNSPLQGELKNAHLLDIAPTLLELGGYDLPSSMQGKSLVSTADQTLADGGLPPDQEEIVRERLRGLGYIS